MMQPESSFVEYEPLHDVIALIAGRLVDLLDSSPLAAIALTGLKTAVQAIYTKL